MKPSKSLSSAIATASSGDPPTTLAPEVRDLISSLNRRRLFREVTLSLRSGIRDLSADFSFLRVRGLRSLLESLNYFASNDASINMFRHSQSTVELQVVPVLFQNSLQLQKGDPGVKLEDIFGVEPMKVNSPASNHEISLALRVLEGCCLLHSESLVLAHKHKAVKVLLNIISTGDALVQGACLDALISLMLDSSSNQMDFENANGMKKIAELMKDEQLEENTRLKCAEFLLLLIGHVNGRRNQAPLATINDVIRHLFGEKAASLIWSASQSTSALDPEQRVNALHTQAQRVLESVDLYRF